MLHLRLVKEVRNVAINIYRHAWKQPQHEHSILLENSLYKHTLWSLSHSTLPISSLAFFEVRIKSSFISVSFGAKNAWMTNTSQVLEHVYMWRVCVYVFVHMIDWVYGDVLLKTAVVEYIHVWT